MGTVLQEMLRAGTTLAEIQSRYAVRATRHRTLPNLVLFKYNQIESPFGERIVQESRGIVLDEAEGWRSVSRAFDKFFNYGEGHAAAIDWSSARVQEKVDGSLLVLYHYAGSWRVATSGTPDASGDVYGAGFMFSDLFWRTFEAMCLPFPEDADLCFAFELVSPWNRVVVRHQDARLVLLAVRNRETGLELPPETFASSYPVVRSFPLQSMDDVLATFSGMDPLVQEGYVIVDGAFRRVKVKHPGYVAIHHMRGNNASTKRFLEIVRSGESSELLTHFPEWKPEFDRVEKAYVEASLEVSSDFERLRGIAVQKDFALEAVKTRCPAALFMLRSGKVSSVREFLAGMQPDRLMELLRLRDRVLGE